jgi:hypothetical protein
MSLIKFGYFPSSSSLLMRRCANSQANTHSKNSYLKRWLTNIMFGAVPLALVAANSAAVFRTRERASSRYAAGRQEFGATFTEFDSYYLNKCPATPAGEEIISRSSSEPPNFVIMDRVNPIKQYLPSWPRNCLIFHIWHFPDSSFGWRCLGTVRFFDRT